MHSHHHHHHHHHHHSTGHHHPLSWAVVLTIGFAFVEAILGWRAGSLALLSDAGHMVTDSIALALAAVAGWMATRPATERLSYGFSRIEVLAALINVGFMFALICGIAWTAVSRLLNPISVNGATVTSVAIAGLLVNGLVAFILFRGERNINTRGALLHVMGDLLGSVAALLSGIVIQATGWTRIDPLLSVLICILIFRSSWQLAREAVHTLMEGVPEEISLPDVGNRLAAVQGVISVHDLHIWTLSSSRTALSAHIVVKDVSRWSDLLPELLELLREEFHIEHTTLQPEPFEPTLYAIVDPDRQRSSA